MTSCVDLSSRISVLLSYDGTTTAHARFSTCCIFEPSSHCDFIDTGNSFSFSLESIFRFDAMMQKLLTKQTKHVVVCPGFEENRQVKTLMLLGCHMIMSRGMSFEETVLAFRPLNTLLQMNLRGISSFEAVLRAMCCAKCLSWIHFGLEQTNKMDDGIQMDEYIHYARYHPSTPANSHTKTISTPLAPTH